MMAYKHTTPPFLLSPSSPPLQCAERSPEQGGHQSRRSGYGGGGDDDDDDDEVCSVLVPQDEGPAEHGRLAAEEAEAVLRPGGQLPAPRLRPQDDRGG